jgi:hypothetical protein
VYQTWGARRGRNRVKRDSERWRLASEDALNAGRQTEQWHFSVEAFVSSASEMVGRRVERNLSGFLDVPVSQQA